MILPSSWGGIFHLRLTMESWFWDYRNGVAQSLCCAPPILSFAGICWAITHTSQGPLWSFLPLAPTTVDTCIVVCSPAVEARVPWVQSSSTWPQGFFGCLSLLFCHSFLFGGVWWEALRSLWCPSMRLFPACVSLHLPTPLWLGFFFVTFLSLTSHLYLELSKILRDSLVGTSRHIFWSWTGFSGGQWGIGFPSKIHHTASLRSTSLHYAQNCASTDLSADLD